MMRTCGHLSRRVLNTKRKKAFFLTAAAALSTRFAPGVQAFSIYTNRPKLVNPYAGGPLLDYAPSRQVQTRLYSGKNQGGFLETLKEGAKKILPSSWFQSEKEKKAAIARRRAKDEVKGGLKELLKDAPLPVRMMGGMISPLISSAMSGLAETMQEQQQEVETVLNDAKSYLLSDPSVAMLLGDGPLQVGAPFSQSSSSSSINGQTTSRVEIAFPVQGPMQSGVAKATSTNGSLAQLILQAGGRTINVSMSSKSPRASAFGRSKNSDDDDIIEAEIIEKDTKL